MAVGSLSFEVLYQRNRFIIQFMMTHSPDFTAGSRILEVLDQVAEAKNRSGLRIINKDIKEFISCLPRFQQLLLQKQLAELQLLD